MQNPEGGSHLRRRTKRGLYKSAQGQLINADCNGAANILRKADATLRRRKAQRNAHQEVATQIGINLSEVGRASLNVPQRYRLERLSKSYRERYEASF